MNIVEQHFSFNSTMVRLKDAKVGAEVQMLCRFNSTMVRLKGLPCYPSPNIDDHIWSFNSTMVRLKAHSICKGPLVVQHLSFNSTMVRLKDAKVGPEVQMLCRFNIHNGSIKRPRPVTPHLMPIVSIPHGSIKSTFYSKGPLVFVEFQFHNGSIKANRTRLSDTSLSSSIPQWFD